jgi:hypothetical protein
MMIYPLVYLIIWMIPTAIRVRHQDPFGQIFFEIVVGRSLILQSVSARTHANYSVFPDIPGNNGKVCTFYNWNC